ncbi:hypothetical protein [Streptomyces mirabilis]|uniref:hypothetical protein n=1 Tax=Streptomyces mirabilis TaxID=68239 RepID=UPI0036E4DB93
MRNREKALSVLEALGERGRATGHGWVLDTEFLLPHQQSVNALEGTGLVELAGRGGPCGAVGAGGPTGVVGGPRDPVRT